MLNLMKEYTLKHYKKSLIVMTILGLGYSSTFTIEPSQMGNIRRLGHVAYNTPLSSGLHFKVPFIDTVDTTQVSLTTLHIPQFDVNTVDNQKITLDINFNYTIPSSKVNHILYEIGQSGNVEIADSIIPVVKDRVARIFNQHNTTTLSLNREAIQNKVTKAVFGSMTEMFGLQPHSLQIAQIIYSPTFVQSNENAVRAKNDAVAEQNKQVVETAKAQQKVIAAEGEAKSAIVRAEADKTKQILDGEGQRKRLELEISAFNNNPSLYISYLDAKAKLRWDGKVPSVYSSGSNSNHNIVVPFKSE